jgi:hypothetical protein
MKSKISELNAACTFECVPTNDTVITQIDYLTFAITNVLDHSKLVCDGEQTEYLEVPPTGAIEVILPCGCLVVMHGRPSVRPPFPCPYGLAEAVKITLILPAAWASMPNVYLSVTTQHEAPTYSNLSAVLNANWSEAMPVVKLASIPEKILL